MIDSCRFYSLRGSLVADSVVRWIASQPVFNFFTLFCKDIFSAFFVKQGSDNLLIRFSKRLSFKVMYSRMFSYNFDRLGIQVNWMKAWPAWCLWGALCWRNGRGILMESRKNDTTSSMWTTLGCITLWVDSRKLSRSYKTTDIGQLCRSCSLPFSGTLMVRPNVQI